MPIYAYKCESCGYAKDVLQKMSDPQLTDCPQCAAPAFKKQLTAAGFQLKGSGWYVTDFRGGDNAQAAKPADGAAPEATGSGNKAAEGGAAPAGTSSTASPDVASPKAAAAAPAGKSGGSAPAAPSASSSPAAKAA